MDMHPCAGRPPSHSQWNSRQARTVPKRCRSAWRCRGWGWYPSVS